MKKITLLLLAMSLSFCTKNDNDAVDNPIDPVDNPALMKELTASPEGWKLTYISSDDSFGGYHFLMKFDVRGKVTMLSDLSATATPTTSSYSTQEEGRGLVLSFIGNNQIHLLANALQGAIGNAHTGKVYQFLYTGKEGNNLKFQNLLLSGMQLVFEPATAADWSRTPALYKNITPLTTAAAHYYLKVSTATGTPTTYPIEFTNRVLSLKNTQSKVAVLATEKGVAFHRAFTLGGQSFTELERVAGSVPPVYKATVNGVTAELFYSSVPPNFFDGDDYKDINTTIEAFALMSQYFKNNEYMTEAFYEDVLKVDASTDLYMLRVMFDGATDCHIQIGHIFPEKGFSVLQISCKYELKNKRLYFKDSDKNLSTSAPDVWGDEKNKAILEQAQRALGSIYALGAQGLYIKKLNIKVKPQEDNPVYLLQSYEFPLYAFPIWGVPL
ncbi:DUF4302 domain-containing protein [Capnocytophaga genosp. AHN8471]|uniref:DUF4302 domain-containing protein n=1 Tax=Capnocytophaga genosp. AHN8471 TaxID=327574 RepID=A0ABS1YZN1_9FLAO|nr:DUF4302 domain-containing protein [Capnocytophaga genosp. AHN8471]MBM0651869.1 DUF4302 domain-containing protein [Capnocytophaga genosp. AHN8471]MBM0657857.1 DUF4302 domain-containing protein [Capnocytophaga genosp. AHN8471]